MGPWQWFFGTLEFIAAWTATECFFIWRRRPPKVWKQPTDPAVHPNDWPKPPVRVPVLRDPIVGDSILHIPDDWREIMKRKEIAYYNGRVTRQSVWREGLDYSWWPDP